MEAIHRMSMTKWVMFTIVLAATFLGGWWLGQYASRPEIVERVRIDTVFYERPQPFAVTDRPVAVNVPRMLFAPADTVNRTIVVGDSVQITVTERTLEYRDSTYYARVVGPVVGTLGPGSTTSRPTTRRSSGCSSSANLTLGSWGPRWESG